MDAKTGRKPKRTAYFKCDKFGRKPKCGCISDMAKAEKSNRTHLIKASKTRGKGAFGQFKYGEGGIRISKTGLDYPFKAKTEGDYDGL